MHGRDRWMRRKRAAGYLCGYPCQPAGVQPRASMPRGRVARSGSSASATIVGYGADPEWAVDTVMDLVEDGAIAVRGNHDNAIGTPSETMNAEAQAAIEWTRGRLSAPQRRFLAELPLTRQEDDRLYVHSEASSPARWRYVQRHVGRRAQHRGDRRPCHILRPHPPAGALFDVVGGEDDELRPDIRRAGAIARRPALARGSRLGRAAPRRQSGGRRLRCSIPRRARSPIAACLTTSRRRRTGFAPTACRIGWPIACSWGGEAMAKPSIEPGAELDGFTIGECVHRGGMATLWTVTHPGITVPLLMKVPAGFRGRGSGGHRQLRDGADDPAAAGRTARARLFRYRRFRTAGLCRDGAHSRQDALRAGSANCRYRMKRRG